MVVRTKTDESAVSVRPEMRVEIVSPLGMIPEEEKDGIRCRFLEGDRPVWEGMVPVFRATIERVIDHYAEAVRPLNPKNGKELLASVIRLEAIRHYHRKSRNPLLHDLPDLLQALVVKNVLKRSGDKYFRRLPERARFHDFLRAAAGGLGVPMRALTRHVMGRYDVPRGSCQPLLPCVIQILNLLSVKKPWEVLYRLYREELDWAFSPRRGSDGELVFEVGSLSGLENLGTSGFGPFLNSARQQRDLKLRGLGDQISLKRGAVHLPRLARIETNQVPPDFPTLRLLVETLNQRKNVAAVDRALAFLASFPSFLRLLPLKKRGTNRVLFPKGPFEFVPYPDPDPKRYRQKVYGRRVHYARLDPKGFYALIANYQKSRVPPLTDRKLAEKLEISLFHLERMRKGLRRPVRTVPGRQIILRLCSDEGLAIPLEKVLRAHRHSCWGEDPVVTTLDRRTFKGRPVFIDQRTFRKLEGYARYSFQTPGEILCFWRMSPAEAEEKGPLLPTEEETAKRIGINASYYDRWELNRAVLGQDQMDLVIRRLGRSKEDRLILEEANKNLAKELAAQEIQQGDWLGKYPGVAKIFSLQEMKPARTDRKRWLAWAEFLRDHDKPSLDFLDKKGQAVGNPYSREIPRILVALKRTTERRKNLRRGLKIKGRPLASFYYHNYGGQVPFRRFWKRIQNPAVSEITIHEDGSFSCP